MSAYHSCVDERRPRSRAAIARGIGEHGVTVNRIRAVAGADEEMWNAVQELRDAAAGCLDFRRHADRVAVVLDEEKHRRPARGGGADGLPEFTLARGALAARDADDFIAVHVRDPALALEIHDGLGAADRVKKVHAGRGRA